jgi:hypothetical protein
MYAGDESVHYARGEGHYRARLTENQVRRLYQCWRAHRTEWGIQARLARRFHISPAVVGAIVHGKAWRQVTRALR